MDNPVARLLTLLELLQTHRRLSGIELARRLGVTPRTVRRYIATLQDVGLPVGGEIGRYGGYRLRPGYRLPPLMLTDDEALAVVLGLLAGKRWGLPAAGHAVEGALAKLHRVLPDTLRQQLEATRDAVRWGMVPSVASGGEQPVGAAVLLALGVAVHDGRRVRLTYRARSGETSVRAVDPYGIVFQSGRWYLAGLDHMRQSARTFRVDRVLAIEETDHPTARPAAFDAVAYVQKSIATVPYAWSVEVLLGASPAEARRLVSPALGTLHERPDGVVLRFGTNDLDWAARYLVGLGCRFRVGRPAVLVEVLRRLAGELLTIEDAQPVSDTGEG